MKCRTVCATAIALLLTLASTAVASTTWYVDGVHGNDHNNCKTRTTACKTIGHAISLASSGDTIGVGPATYTENFNIDRSLRIVGSGASTTIVNGGMYKGSVILLNGPTASLSKLTIGSGSGATRGGGIYMSGGSLTITDSSITGNQAVEGGGIYIFAGQLMINNSTITLNKAVCPTYLCTAAGGGIYNFVGSLTINASTFADNFTVNCGTSCPTIGGGIFNGRTATINNSTISHNSAETGGGIFNKGTITISNTTLSNNPAGGGGIYNVGMASLQNSIVADNSGGNCSGTMNSNGHNLSSDATCNFNNTGDLNNTDPLLGPLQNNGGPTQTEALLAGSPAIDAGNPNGCTDGSGNLLTTDQRGRPRPDKEDSNGCDMGAYERQSD